MEKANKQVFVSALPQRGGPIPSSGLRCGESTLQHPLPLERSCLASCGLIHSHALLKSIQLITSESNFFSFPNLIQFFFELDFK